MLEITKEKNQFENISLFYFGNYFCLLLQERCFFIINLIYISKHEVLNATF